MRLSLLAFTLSILTLSSASAEETRCHTTCNWGQCYTRCWPVYSEYELYLRGQAAATRELDYRSGDRGYGARQRFNGACTRALESGVDPDLMSSYGCRN